QLNLWSQGGSEVIRGNLLVIPIEDTVLYVEPVYIESSNETSLPEVKQVIMAYEDTIVMEETFDKALEKVLATVGTGKQPDQEVDPDDSEKREDEGQEPEEEMEEAPILNAELELQEIGNLFDAYQEAMADGDWITAGQVMDEITK